VVAQRLPNHTQALDPRSSPVQSPRNRGDEANMLARRVLSVALVPYAVWLVAAYHYHFLDGVNLAFHEAGHLFLAPAGQMLHVLGGTLAQLLVPLLCAGHFVREGKRFEPWICVFWAGESLMYTAVYMADALEMALPLVGGGEIHDWNYLLARWGLLAHCGLLARATHALASAIVLGALGSALWIAFAAPAQEPSAASARRSG
jgi:hypothetical protein